MAYERAADAISSVTSISSLSLGSVFVILFLLSQAHTTRQSGRLVRRKIWADRFMRRTIFDSDLRNNQKLATAPGLEPGFSESKSDGLTIVRSGPAPSALVSGYWRQPLPNDTLGNNLSLDVCRRSVMIGYF